MKNAYACMLACLLALCSTPCFAEIKILTDENTGKTSAASIFIDTVFLDHTLEADRVTGATSFFKETGSDGYLLRLGGSEEVTDASSDSYPKANIIIDSVIYEMPFHGSSGILETRRDSILTGYSEYTIGPEAIERLTHARSVWIELRSKLESPIHWKVSPEMLNEWKAVIRKNTAAS